MIDTNYRDRPLSPIGEFDTSPSDLQELIAQKKLKDQQDAHLRYYTDTLASAGSLSNPLQNTAPTSQPFKPVDSIASAKVDVSNPTQESTSALGKIFNWISSFFYSSTPTQTAVPADEPTGSYLTGTPKLQPPSPQHIEKIAKYLDKLNRDLERIKEICQDEGSANCEGELEQFSLRVFYKLVRENSDIKQHEAISLQEQMSHQHDMERKLQTEFFNLHKELEANLSTIDTLGWIKLGASVVSGAALALTAAAVLGPHLGFTAVVAFKESIDLYVAIIGVIATASSGASTVKKANLSHENDVKTGQMEEFKHGKKQYHNTNVINSKELKEALDSMYKHCTKLVALLNAQNKAMQSITG